MCFLHALRVPFLSNLSAPTIVIILVCYPSRVYRYADIGENIQTCNIKHGLLQTRRHCCAGLNHILPAARPESAARAPAPRRIGRFLPGRPLGCFYYHRYWLRGLPADLAAPPMSGTNTGSRPPRFLVVIEVLRRRNRTTGRITGRRRRRHRRPSPPVAARRGFGSPLSTVV